MGNEEMDTGKRLYYSTSRPGFCLEPNPVKMRYNIHESDCYQHSFPVYIIKFSSKLHKYLVRCETLT